MKIEKNHSIKDIRDITFIDVINSIARVKIEVLFSLVCVFFTYSFMVFQLGCILQNQRTAITFRKPFDMYLSLEQDGVNQSSTDSRLELKKIYLIPAEYTSGQENHLILKIRRVLEDYSTVSMGHVVAQKGKIYELPNLSGFLALSAAYAAEKFEWHGHENNYQFHEEFVARSTIRRYYDDGWILEYKINAKGDAIISTFRWIKKGQN